MADGREGASNDRVRGPCRYCPAQIIWGFHKPTRRMLLFDQELFWRREVQPRRRWYLLPDARGFRAYLEHEVPAGSDVNLDRVYVVHFATCPGRRQQSTEHLEDAVLARYEEYRRMMVTP